MNMVSFFFDNNLGKQQRIFWMTLSRKLLLLLS
jgi:hypothetical protein